MRANEFLKENKVRPNIDIVWDSNFIVKALIDGKVVGSAEFASDDPNGEYGFYAISVGVSPEYRRMGVATAMYNAAEEKFGEIIPSEHQTDDARAFWKSYGDLKEAFDQPYSSEFADDDYAQAKDDKGHPINVSFTDWSWDGNIVKVDFDRSKGYDLTGKGDEFRVFATVVDAVRKFVDKNHPPVFVFLPKRDSPARATLYKRMVQRLSPSIGYVDITANPTVLADKKISAEITKAMRRFPEADWIFVARKDVIKAPGLLNKLGFK